jgi:hypothetical protein
MLTDCAVTNNIFGANTAARFTDFSDMYFYYTFGAFFYFVFIDWLMWVVIWWIGAFTLGAGYWLYPLYWFASRFCLAFLQLFWDNEIYEAFHPVLAPELANARPAESAISGN